MRSHRLRLFAALACALTTSNWIVAQDSPRPLRIREIWVPEDELLELQKDQPDGVVLSLAEYRQLVLAGLPRREGEKAQLPPHNAVVRTAEHVGTVANKTVRFSSELEVHVLHDAIETSGWVKCPLSPLPPSLGSVQVDGQPGWLVRGGKEGDFVLLRGKGKHTITLSFVTPRQENEDRSKVASVVPKAQSARVVLEVAGRAEARANPAYLHTEPVDPAAKPEDARTRFVVALGSGTSFEIDWRRRRSQGENDSLISASHAVDALPRRAAPTFRSRTRVLISRRKTDLLELVEAAGTQIVSLNGTNVHSWERTESGIQIRLSAATLGVVDLNLAGVLSGSEITERGRPATRFEIGVPTIRGAYSNSGWVGVHAPNPDHLDSEVLGTLTEVSPVDVAAFSGYTLARAYSFPSSDARLRLTTREHQATFETTAACLVRVLESGVRLEGLFHVNVGRGRVYRHDISIPQPWTFDSLEILPRPDGSNVAVRHELIEENGATRLALDFSHASDGRRPLTFRLRLHHADFEPDISWIERPLSFSVPTVTDAERSRVDVGVALTESMYAVFPDLPRWNVLDREGLALVGLDDTGLVAGLSATLGTGEPALPPITLTLRHHRPQGEFQAVTHLLALGERVRVRADVKIAVVDRAVDTLRITLPVPEAQLVLVPGDGIQEITSVAANATSNVGATLSSRIIRYSRPWIGTREFRVEYEVELDTLARTDGGSRVPWIEIDDGASAGAGAGAATSFRSDSSIVFQSLGPVKVEVAPGDELVADDVDELPEIGEPWGEGRLVFGHRFRAASGSRLPLGRAPARFRVLEFDRAESVDVIVRELELVTALDADGTSRTRAELLLAYGRRWQHLDVRLDPNAKLITVSIDDVTEHRVRSREGNGLWKIPLPSRSYARIAIVYERSGASGSSLSSWGSWREIGPDFGDVPVVESNWTLYHPRGFRFFLEDGNLESSTPALETRDRSFLAGFFRRLGEGRFPLSRGHRAGQESREFYRQSTVDAAGSTGSASAAPPNNAFREQQAGNDLLRPVAQQARPGEDSELLLELLPSGYVVEARKLGGSAVLELSYRRLVWWKFSDDALFLLTLVAGFVLASRGGRREFWPYATAAFLTLSVAADFLSWSIGWESPFLWTPICRGLFVLLLLGGAWELYRFVSARARAKREASLANLVIAGTLGTLAAFGMTRDAFAKRPAPPKNEDRAIITFDPASFPWIQGQDNKVFLPHETFRKLWRLANPDESTTHSVDVKPIVDYVIGNASYVLEPSSDTYSLVADIDVRVFTKDWVTIHLPFSNSQVSRITLDGVALGVSQRGRTAQVSFRGVGARRLRVEARGAIDRQPGSFRIASNLLRGSATRIGAKLPAGAKPTSPAGHGGILVTPGDERVLVEIHLSQGAHLDLSWTFPSQKGEQASRVESTSYSDLLLTLDGYNVSRQERVRVTGSPTDSLDYEIVGAWSIRHVQAPELAEWTVVEEDGAQRLKVFFSRPLESVELLIGGWAALGDKPADPGKPIASLQLVGAIRQTNHIGLRHGARRRWDSEALSANRSSPDALTATYSLAASNPPLRAYEFHGSVANAIVSATPVTGTSDLTTNAVLVVGRNDATISARTRFRTGAAAGGGQGTSTGPIRQEVELATGWEVRSVAGSTVRDWETIPGATGTRLVIELTSRATNDTEVVWTAQSRYASPPANFTVPSVVTATSPASRSEAITWAVAAADSLEVRLAPTSTGVQIVPRDSTRQWIQLPPHSSYVFDVRTTGAVPQYSISLAVGEPASKVSALAVLFARPAEDFVLVNSRIVFRVGSGSVDLFRIRAPNEAQDVRLFARNQKSLSTAADGTLDLSLMSSTVGEHAATLSYRLPRTPNDVRIDPFVLSTDAGVIPDVGFWVGVIESDRTQSSATPRNLEDTTAAQLPFLPDGVAIDSLGHTYRSTRPDWSLGLSTETLQRGAAVAARVDLVDLVTVIGIDGTLRTEANYTVRNRELQFLRIRLPADAKLWRATVDGKAVVASQADGVLQIPLKHLGEADLDLVIGLVYEQPKLDMPSLWTNLDLEAPHLLGSDEKSSDKAISVSRTLWRVELPEGYEAVLSDGTVDQVVSSIEFASKVDANLREVDRLTNLLESETKPTDDGGKKRRRRLNRRQRVALESNLKKLQQQLGDNVMDLRQTNDVADQIAAQQQLEGGLVEEQKAEATGRLEEALRAQERLAGAIKDTEGQDAGERSAAEQAFEDQSNFLGNDWVDNRRAPKGTTPPGADPRVDLFELVEGRKLPRVSVGSRGAWTETEIDTASPRSVQGGGLDPLDTAQVAQASPALETPPAPRGTTSLSFRTMSGDAKIVLKIQRVGVSNRFFSLAALFAVGIAWYLLLRRRPR